MDSIKQQLNALVSKAMVTVSGLSDCNANVVTATKPEFGDYQANGVMALAGPLRRNPQQLAQQVVDAIQHQPLIADLQVAGPGFINIRLSNTFLLTQANHALADPDLFISKSHHPQKIVVDYSSPNLAKEMHVGHLRGTIIGDCLARVLEQLGHQVVRQNHVGDWGTQFGMLIAHLRDLEADSSEISSRLTDLEVFYQQAKQRFDTDPAFANESRRSVVKLQAGEAEYRSAWQQFINESLNHCEAIYQKLAVTLSSKDLDAESRYNADLPNVIADLQARELLTESDGARCVFLDQFKGKDGELLPLIVQKSDGGYLYATTDLAAIRWRRKQQIERALYVVDARQSLHFEQVFAVAHAADFAGRKLSLEHIAYGTIMGQDGRPFRTRSGDSVKLVALLDEAINRAGALVATKNPQLSPQEKTLVAQRVGIGAVKYADLVKNRTSDYVFDWDKMLSLEGNTAPYLLYAYARIRSMLRRAPAEPADQQITMVQQPEERALLLKILQLPEVLMAVARDCYPNQLCNYLYELAGIFMRFYEVCPVLRADADSMQSRLALARLTARTLQQGLDLLGIATLERM